MQVLRVQLLLMNRAAEAAYRPQMTSQFPKPPLSWVPSIFKVCGHRPGSFGSQTTVLLWSASQG